MLLGSLSCHRREEPSCPAVSASRGCGGDRRGVSLVSILVRGRQMKICCFGHRHDHTHLLGLHGQGCQRGDAAFVCREGTHRCCVNCYNARARSEVLLAPDLCKFIREFERGCKQGAGRRPHCRMLVVRPDLT